MHAAGIRRLADPVALLELPGPRPLRADEVLIQVHAGGVGNWDEFVRTGDWDTGTRPPMALGVEAAGLVTATGAAVHVVHAGDRVTTHSVPLREQGSWAEQLIAPEAHVAAVPFGAGAALPVPALTADQVLSDALHVRAGQTVLVNGAGGVTGGLIVQLAVHYGATVLATANPPDAERIRAMGAAQVLDYHQRDWPGQVRTLTGGGADLAANAVGPGPATPCGPSGMVAAWPRLPPTRPLRSGASRCGRYRSSRTGCGWDA
jgi:NADPH:quinone reductase-like Zn-dependent oxidoreductase